MRRRGRADPGRPAPFRRQIWRSFPDREPRHPRRRSWLIFFISAAVLTVVFFGLGQYWQYLIRGLMGVTEYNSALVVASPFVAALVFCCC